MKKEELNKTIQEEIAEINDKLIALDDEKEKLIQLQTQLEMKKRNEESKATAERIRKARTREHNQTKGRWNAKFRLLNAVKEQRRARKERIENDKDI